MCSAFILEYNFFPDNARAYKSEWIIDRANSTQQLSFRNRFVVYGHVNGKLIYMTPKVRSVGRSLQHESSSLTSECLSCRGIELMTSLQLLTHFVSLKPLLASRTCRCSARADSFLGQFTDTNVINI